MNTTEAITLLVEKQFADKITQKEFAEIAIRRNDAKFSAIIKAKLADKTLDLHDERLLSLFEEKKLPNIEMVRSELTSLNLTSNLISNKIKNLSVSADRIFQSVNALKNISYINIGISLANLAVNAVGFSIISTKLSVVMNELNSIDSKIDALLTWKKNDMIEQYNNFVIKSNTYFDSIKNNDKIDHKDLGNFVGEIYSFIKKLMNNIKESNFSEVVFLEIINALFPTYAALLYEYLQQYYYSNKAMPSNYSTFVGLFSDYINEDFRNGMFDYLFMSKKEHLYTAIDTVNAQILLAINNRIQIEDEIKLLELCGSREKRQTVQFELDKILKEDVLNTIYYEDTSEKKQNEHRVFIERLFQ